MSTGGSMKISKVIMGIALIVLGILLISMFWPMIGAKTAKQIDEDYDSTNMNFKSYNAGDIVLIKDEIKDIKYANTTKSTNIVFEGKNGNVNFTFKGELRPFLIGEYKKGDTVLIILKVEKKNNSEWFEGSVYGNSIVVSSDKIHKLYLGGNAFFCGIILIGVLVLVYGLLKKKPKPAYYQPQPYPAQPVYPQPPQYPTQYPPQPTPQYPPPPQYQQQPQPVEYPPQYQQPRHTQPMYPPQPTPPQYQQPQQQYPSYQQPQTPVQPQIKSEPAPQMQPYPAEYQQPVPQQPAKKGLFQRLKKLGKREKTQPAPPVPSEKQLALEQPVHEQVQPAQQPIVEKTVSASQIPKFCPDCGAETKGRKFCGNCGSRLGE